MPVVGIEPFDETAAKQMLFPCCFCGNLVPVEIDSLDHTTCSQCRLINQPMEESKMSELSELKRKRLELLAAIVQVDSDIRAIAGRELVPQPFNCSCLKQFKTYLERQLHICTEDNPQHYPMGQHKQYFICPDCKGKYISKPDLDKHSCKPVKPQLQSRLGRNLINLNIIE
jgi:hypothetical protein